MIKKDDFVELRNEFGVLLDYEVFPQENLGASPKGNCNKYNENKVSVHAGTYQSGEIITKF